MKEPRAIPLEDAPAPKPAAKADARSRGPVIVSEPEAILPDAPRDPAVEPGTASRGFGWGKLFASALGGLALMALTGWAESVILQQFQRAPWLGWLALGLAALAVLALLVVAGRALRDLLRGRRIDRLRDSAARALVERNRDEALAVAREVSGLLAGRPETARGRSRLDAALPGLMTAPEILTVVERELLVPADQAAAQIIARQARQVSLVTAVSPRAVIDVAFVAYACFRVIREVAAVYGARPGPLGLLKLARGSFVHLLATGGMAAGDALIQQIIGQGLAARLSAKLGEGALNGLMTARFGLAAMALCRPMAPVVAPLPGLKDVAGELLTGSAAEKA